MKRSSRQVKPNTKYSSNTLASTEDSKRKCERSGCTATVPICFARVSERCAGSGWTSRWYHLTLGEHYCNECFEHFYRSHKDGYKDYDQWKREWSLKARTEAGIAVFMVEKILPYWVQCRASGCGKWRQLSRDLNLTSEFIDTFVCGCTSVQGPVKKDTEAACSIPEDERVHYVRSPLWLIQNRCTSFLKNSPAALFLSNYYADGVGLSPTDMPVELSKEEKKKLCPYVVPFPKGDHPLHAFSVMPDMMMDAEIDSFPLIAQECPYMYLALRNLILALWVLNPKEWVTKEKCMRLVICRGLARVSCIETLPQVLFYLTYHNYINQGLVAPPSSLHLHTQESVIVVGAGTSGLAAAHLLRSYGIQVTVVEAKNRLGGRVEVDGVIVSTSDNVLAGCTNNPLAIMAYQAGIDLEEQADTCQLVSQTGKLVDEKLARRIEFHYNAILDIVAEWRKNGTPQADVPLIEKFKEFHEEFVRETEGYFSELRKISWPNGSTLYSKLYGGREMLQETVELMKETYLMGLFSQEEGDVMNFYLSYLERTCGCSLSQLSSLHWDQHEDMLQFSGRHLMMPMGFGAILSKLAQGLDVRYNCKVTDITYNESGVHVATSSGLMTADKVIVTLPLSVLKQKRVTFHPSLPESKLKAIRSLGTGHIEKVILQFDEDFWSEKINGCRPFGLVPASESQRGLFNIFYPTSCKQSARYMLSSYLVGEGLRLMEGKSDEEVVQANIQVLRTIFPEKDIPSCVWSYVTHWNKDPDIGMAYSYLPVGADGTDYDLMVEDVGGRVYFAGEATNRQFPQSVAGAYLSGVREARKVMDSFS